MATRPVTTGAPTRAPFTDWIEHDGRGRPIPIGTLVQARMFNGDVQTFTAGGATFDLDGSPIPAWRSAGWSGWDYSDGGPMAPKFRAYRVVASVERQARNVALFRSWLDVRELVDAGGR